MLSGKATMHIAIWWFFITDMIKQGEIVIKDCPSKDMWGAVVTKPLQGGLYTKFRNLIQGVQTKDFKSTRKIIKLSSSSMNWKTHVQNMIQCQPIHRSVLEAEYVYPVLN